MRKYAFRALGGALAIVLTVLTVSLAARFSAHVGLVQAIGASAEPVVIIDAGHGDFDPGAIARDGTDEKDLNLAISLQLRDIFASNGYTVVMTRTGDETLAFNGPSEATSAKRSDTQNRAKLAGSFENAVMISIHQNAFADRTQHGTQVFYGTKDERSELLAETIAASVRSGLQPDNKRECKRGTDSIYILTHAEAPIVLVECGFMTNEAELASLKDHEYQQKLAYCIYNGYRDYLTSQ